MDTITVLEQIELVLIDGSGEVLALTAQERSVFAGDRVRVPWRLRKQDGTAPADLTGIALFLTVTRAGSTTALFTREDTTADRSTDDDGNPIGYFDLYPADTIRFNNPSTYRFGAWCEDADGDPSHLMLASNLGLLETKGRIGDDITAATDTVPIGAGPSGTSAEQVTADEAVDQYATLKAAGGGRYVMLDVADDASLFIASSTSAAAAQGDTFGAQFVMGPSVILLSDGTDVIGAGELIMRSDTVKGRVKAGTENPIGVNTGAAVAATLDAQVTARCRTIF